MSRVRYAVYVTALGHVFHLLWGTEEIEDWIFGLMGALGLELVLWEIVGNSDLVHNKIRDTQAADTSYENTLGGAPPNIAQRWNTAQVQNRRYSDLYFVISMRYKAQ